MPRPVTHKLSQTEKCVVESFKNKLRFDQLDEIKSNAWFEGNSYTEAGDCELIKNYSVNNQRLNQEEP